MRGSGRRYRASIPLPMFDLIVRLIWLSNINFTEPEVIAGLPVHFHALVSKGLDPIWIDVDIANDCHDLFLYVHWLATEKNSLGGEGYTYDVARAAVRFYVENVHRLIDIPPRRLSMIAKVIRDNPSPAARDERLEQMLRPTDQRPKLILPESWVPVLLWPANPPPQLNPEPLSGARQPDPVETAPEPEPDPPPAARQPDPFETAPATDRAEMHGNAGQIPEYEGAPEPEPVPPLAEPEHWTEAVVTFGGQTHRYPMSEYGFAQLHHEYAAMRPENRSPRSKMRSAVWRHRCATVWNHHSMTRST